MTDKKNSNETLTDTKSDGIKKEIIEVLRQLSHLTSKVRGLLDLLKN